MFTKDQMNKWMEQAKDILASLGTGSCEERMAQLYVEAFPGKTINQGRLMAQQIIETVDRYAADLEKAKQDTDLYLEGVLDELAKGKNGLERCNLWYGLNETILTAAACQADQSIDIEQAAKGLNDAHYSEEEVSDALEENLRAQLIETIKNSSVGITAPFAEAISQAADGQTGDMLVDVENHTTDFRAAVAMIAYTEIKNGRVENVPVETTAAQTAAAVCTAIEQLRIMNDVAENNLAMDIAEMLLKLVSAVGLTVAFVPLLAVGITVCQVLFAWYLALPMMMLYTAVVVECFGEALDGALKVDHAIAKGIVVAGKTIWKGACIAANYIKNELFPCIVTSFGVFVNKLKKKKTETVEAELVTE